MDRRWILGGVLLAGGVGVARAISERPRLEDDSRILLIGDSFGTGLGRHFQSLAVDENTPFIGAAVPGSSCAHWAASDWLLEKLESFEPSHVLISLGTTDAYSEELPETVADSADEISELIEEHGAHAIWIGSPNLPESFGNKPLQAETLLALKSVAPYYYRSSNLDIPRGPDGFHPTAIGYAGWSAMIWNWLS